MRRHVLVPGGSGQVGEGIVRSLLDDGHLVTVPTRGEHATVTSRFADHPNLAVVTGHTGDDEGARALRDRAVQRAPLTDVVASIGGWWTGPAVGQLAPEEWARVLGRGLDAHFHTANVLLPALTGPRSTYTLINGSGAQQPVRGSGLVNVSAAGQLMLGRVIADEQADSDVNVTSVVIGTPVVSRDRSDGGDGWLTSDQVGIVIAAIIAGAPTAAVEQLDSEEDVRRIASRRPDAA